MGFSPRYAHHTCKAPEGRQKRLRKRLKRSKDSIDRSRDIPESRRDCPKVAPGVSPGWAETIGHAPAGAKEPMQATCCDTTLGHFLFSSALPFGRQKNLSVRARSANFRITMQLNPYIFFNGQCEAAFTYYQQALNGKIVFKMTVGESPMAKNTPAERHNEILHIRLDMGGQVLMGADCPPDIFQQPQGFSVSLNVETPEEAERIFAALARNGHIGMPIAETFWALRFGMVTDQFGIPWMINCEKPM